jgi:hypothetical protein
MPTLRIHLNEHSIYNSTYVLNEKKKINKTFVLQKLNLCYLFYQENFQFPIYFFNLFCIFLFYYAFS